MVSKVVRKKCGPAELGGEKPRGVNKTLIADFPFHAVLAATPDGSAPATDASLQR